MGLTYRLGALLVLLGALAYLAVGVVNLHVDTDIALVRLVGHALVLAGTFVLTRALRLGLAIQAVTMACIVAAAALWVVAHQLPLQELGDFQRFAVLSGIQAALLTTGAGLALGLRANLAVRILAAVALVGNVVAGVLLYQQVTGLVEGTISYDAELAMLHVPVVLDGLLLLPAAVALAKPPTSVRTFRTTPASAAPQAKPTPAQRPSQAAAPPAPRKDAPTFVPTATPAVAPTGRAPTRAAPQGAPAPGAGAQGATPPRAPTPPGGRRLVCPRCKSIILVAPGAKPLCTSCGFA